MIAGISSLSALFGVYLIISLYFIFEYQTRVSKRDAEITKLKGIISSFVEEIERARKRAKIDADIIPQRIIAERMAKLTGRDVDDCLSFFIDMSESEDESLWLESTSTDKDIKTSLKKYLDAE